VFDTFLSYNNADRQDALLLVNKLNERGIRVWIDRGELLPGTPGYRNEVEKAVATAPSAIIAIGSSGPGKWQEFEIDLCIQETTLRRNLVLIPLILPGGDKQKVPPLLLSHFQLSDFRTGFENSPEFDRLQWAITGEKIELLAVQVQKAQSASVLERGQDLDLFAMTYLKALLYQAAQSVASLSGSVISAADEEGGSELTRWVLVLTSLRWQRGYLRAFESLFRVRRSGRFLRDFKPVLVCEEDPDIDGMLGTSSAQDGTLLVTIDGQPVANVNVSATDRAAVERGISAYGRLGKPLAGVQSLLERLRGVPIETVEHEESPLATLFYQNRKVLACLAARYGMPGQDFLLRKSIHQHCPAPEPPSIVSRFVDGKMKQVVLSARRSIPVGSMVGEAEYHEYVKMLEGNPEALSAVQSIFGDGPDAIRESWRMAQTLGRGG
jgi:hypothetical protein